MEGQRLRCRWGRSGERKEENHYQMVKSREDDINGEVEMLLGGGRGGYGQRDGRGSNR